MGARGIVERTAVEGSVEIISAKISTSSKAMRSASWRAVNIISVDAFLIGSVIAVEALLVELIIVEGSLNATS